MQKLSLIIVSLSIILLSANSYADTFKFERERVQERRVRKEHNSQRIKEVEENLITLNSNQTRSINLQEEILSEMKRQNKLLSRIADNQTKLLIFFKNKDN